MIALSTSGVATTIVIVSLSLISLLALSSNKLNPVGEQESAQETLPKHSYIPQIISVSPMMIYLQGFIRPSEIEHLLQLGVSLYGSSRIYSETTDVPDSFRTSHSAVLPSNDTIVHVIKARTLEFLGFLEYDGVEALQLVRYMPGQKFTLHYDWFETPKMNRQGRKYNRLASLFLYLDANCTSGATYFPNLSPPPALAEDDARFTTTAQRKGLGIVPSAGNGMFWMNLKEDGSGDERMLHAGLPVGKGTKVGMNIWIKKIAD